MSESLQRALVTPSPDWLQLLEQRSGARLALGRAGDGLPTAAQLQFGLDHARARDAVHSPLDVTDICAGLDAIGIAPLVVSSMASDRATYLRRPDLGRQLSPTDAQRLPGLGSSPELAVVIADGLSAQAVNANAVPLLAALLLSNPALSQSMQVVVGTGCRVAIGDRIALALGAHAVLVLIGERPGLSSACSMGAYLTWNPHDHTNDAERNCVSNIRVDGLSIALASAQISRLIEHARQVGGTGVSLTLQPPLPMIS